LNFLLWPRVFASLSIDASIAVLCGLLLAMYWVRPLAGSAAVKLPTLRIPALFLLLGLCAQAILLTASFTGETAPAKILAALPDVLSTHPGRVAEITIGVAFLLLIVTLIPRQPLHHPAFFLALCIAIRSATGHAAVDGDFTLAELLQVLHLGSMALWSGGILISGFIALPGLVSAGSAIRSYLHSLSTVSTWAVATVALSGVVKSYRAISGDLHQMKGNDWSYILIAKIVFVTLAIGLGGWNRLRLRAPEPWSAQQNRSAVSILRVEATVMAVVLFLSAWLANMSPPGD
jgi:putative copper resistance protein D